MSKPVRHPIPPEPCTRPARGLAASCIRVRLWCRPSFVRRPSCACPLSIVRCRARRRVAAISQTRQRKFSWHRFAQARTTTSHCRPGQPGPANRPAMGKRRMAARRVRGRPRRQHPARPPTGSFPPFLASVRVAQTRPPMPQKNLRHGAREWPRRPSRDPAVPVPPPDRSPRGRHRRPRARRAR
jgi:hypothetical protein